MKRKVFLLITLIALAASLAASAWAMPVLPPVPSANQVKAKSLTLAPTSVVLRLGSDGTGAPVSVKAKAKPALASQDFDWQSANPAVATVGENGVITPAGLGSTKITCSTTDMSNIKKRVTVRVKKLKVKTLSFDKSEYSIAPNSTAQIGLSIAPANAYDKTVKWSSSNNNVASVDQNGLVTARKLGSCVITCKSPSSGVNVKARVRVNFANSDIYYLSVGQENYMSSRISNLPGCRADADRFAATVDASTFANPTSTAGTTLYNLTGQGIRQALDELPSWGMDENDVTYFFYSGHGAASGALAGVDYSVGGAIAPLVEVAEVREYLDRVPGTVVITVDACYAGKFVAAKSLAGGGDFTQSFVSSFTSAKNTKSLSASTQLKQKYKLLVACREDELAYVLRNGYGSVFTQFLTQAGGVTGIDTGEMIVQKKMAGDANRDGTVTVKEIFNYAYQRVLNKIRKVYGEHRTQRMMVWPLADTYPIFARL